MMGGIRLQMAHELSCGVLYALQSDQRSSCVSITIDDSHSGIQDDTAKHGQSDCDDMEIDQTDQLGDDGDMDDEDDADESDEERTADPNFLVPTYENEPDPNDIFGRKWGKDHYFKEEQCPFEREFIRKVVKEMEHCYDMVLEIFHYLMETESDVKLTASVCTSQESTRLLLCGQRSLLHSLPLSSTSVTYLAQLTKLLVHHTRIRAGSLVYERPDGCDSPLRTKTKATCLMYLGVWLLVNLVCPGVAKSGLSSKLYIGLRPHPNGLLIISDYAALTRNALRIQFHLSCV
ncbi:hypothetical protein EMCRGX_G026564 [Ephydatia muelleri]